MNQNSFVKPLENLKCDFNFSINPENHQPRGYADLSEIYNPKDTVVTYTNLKTGEKEYHNIESTEIIDKNGFKKNVYILPLPYAKKHPNPPFYIVPDAN